VVGFFVCRMMGRLRLIMKKITFLLLFFSSGINAQIALPTFQGVHTRHATPNYAFSFDGTDDRVDIGTTLLSNMSAFTIVFWAYFNTTSPSYQSLVGQNDCIEIFSNGNKIIAWTQTAGNITSNSTTSTSNWYLIVVIGNGSTFKLYINNSQVASRSKSITNYGSNSNYTTTFGSRVKNATANPFYGHLDEIAIWSSALSTDQISNIYNSGTGVNDLSGDFSSNLIGYWKFEQNLNDGSSNSNNGTFSGSSGTNSSATYEDVTSSLSLP